MSKKVTDPFFGAGEMYRSGLTLCHILGVSRTVEYQTGLWK